MSALETYAKMALEQQGVQHLWAIQALRKYIKLCSDQEIERSINIITDVELLRILVEAGMRSPLHQITISRVNLLSKEQQEAKK